MSKNLTNLLGQFRLLKDKYDAVAAATGERFNVFSVLDRERREVTTHSRLLAELLNPKGSHGRGAVFLRLFFEALDVKETFHSDAQMVNFQVTAEAWGGHGSIDILIEGNEKCMVIENKIGADDQERQLGRYYDYAVKKVGGNESVSGRIVVVYLTLDGRAPSDGTLGTNSDKQKFKLDTKDVLCVSYCTHIVKWLDSCIKETARIPRIRETLVQYQSLVKKLTGQTMHRDFIMDTNALFSSSENYRLIPELEQAIPVFKSDLQFRFWETLAEKLKAKFEFGAIDDIGAQMKEVKIRVATYYQSRARKRHNYGIEFAVPEAKVGDIDIGFSVSIHDRIYYGFLVLENRESADSRSIPKCNDQKYEEYRNAISKKAFPLQNEWYLRYKYRDDLNFEEFPETLMQKLLCDTQRTELIGQLVDEIEASINDFRKELNKVP